MRKQCIAAVLMLGLGAPTSADKKPAAVAEKLQYHPIRVDAKGTLLPWQFDDSARAFDSAIRST